MKSYLYSLLTLCAFLLTVATPTVNAQDTGSKNLVELASGTDDLSTLVAAVKAANLVPALSEKDGTYTVFAPTNAAFEALPAGLLDALLMPKNQKVLADILTFHVLENKVMAADAVAGIKADNSGRLIATTMNGNLTLTNVGGKVRVKGEQGRIANVIATDVMATNGVVHLIDKVLLPEGVDATMLIKNAARGMGQKATDEKDGFLEDVGEAAVDVAGAVVEGVTEAGEEVVEIFTGDEKDEMGDRAQPMTMNRNNLPRTTGTMTFEGPTLVDVAVKNGNFTSLTGALTKAGLAETMATTGMYTVFAPTDDAFAALPNGTVASLSNNQLQEVLKFHVIPARISAADLVKAITNYRGGYYRLQTLDGSSLYAYTKGGKVMLVDSNGTTATVVATDVNASNGVVHAIDGVLMPRM